MDRDELVSVVRSECIDDVIALMTARSPAGVSIESFTAGIRTKHISLDELVSMKEALL